MAKLKRVIANEKYIAFEIERLPRTLREVVENYELSGVLKKRIAGAVLAGIVQVSKLDFVHGDVSLDNIYLSEDMTVIKLGLTQKSFYSEEKAKEKRSIESWKFTL